MEKTEDGESLHDAARDVKNTTLFTTHTPIPAGHDVFPLEIMERYFSSNWPKIGPESGDDLLLELHVFRVPPHYMDDSVFDRPGDGDMVAHCGDVEAFHLDQRKPITEIAPRSQVTTTSSWPLFFR